MMDDQKDAFEAFIREKYIQGNTKTSKTVTKDKLQKIVNCLKNDPVTEEYSPSFKHWVKQRGFSLMNYAVLGLKDVLCLPARKKVIRVFYVTVFDYNFMPLPYIYRPMRLNIIVYGSIHALMHSIL